MHQLHSCQNKSTSKFSARRFHVYLSGQKSSKSQGSSCAIDATGQQAVYLTSFLAILVEQSIRYLPLPNINDHSLLREQWFCWLIEELVAFRSSLYSSKCSRSEIQYRTFSSSVGTINDGRPLSDPEPSSCVGDTPLTRFFRNANASC
jgi:hypothetical protein